MHIYTSLLLSATALAVLCVSVTRSEKHVFCYYVSDAQYRSQPGKYLPENIDPSLCTHVIFAFVGIKHNQFSSLSWNDLGPRGLYKRTVGLKARNPNLKVLLAVGGWVADYQPFKEAVSTETKMAEFASSAVTYLRANSMDGLDMDWEFPGSRDSPPEDKQRFTRLLETIQSAFTKEASTSGQSKLILTMAASVGEGFIYAAYETTQVHRHVDFMLLMTYNFHGGWDNVTGHHSGILANVKDVGMDRNLCQAWAVNFWLFNGVPKEKMILGLATYGMTFTLADPKVNDVKAPALGNGRKGPFTNQAGILAYYEICDLLRDPEAKQVWLEEQDAPYVTKGDQWVGYDDVRSLKIKVEKLIHGLDLAGAFIWSVDLDDFSGHCGSGKYPLLKAIKDALGKPPVARSYAHVFPSPLCQKLGQGVHADVTSCHRYTFCWKDQNGGFHQYNYTCPPGLSYDEPTNFCLTKFDCV